MAVERLEQGQQCGGDTATAEDRDPRADQVAAERRGPTGGPGVRAEATHPGESEADRKLRARLGIDTFAARPQPVVVEEMDEGLDPRERKLHPADVLGIDQQFGQRVGVLGIAPHERLGIHQINDLTTAGPDGFSHPRGSG